MQGFVGVFDNEHCEARFVCRSNLLQNRRYADNRGSGSRKLNRTLTSVLMVVVVGATLVSASRHRARQVARGHIGPVSGVVQNSESPMSLVRAEPTGRLAWAVSFTSTTIPGHLAFEVYVSPLGQVLGTNPADFTTRIPPQERRASDASLRHN